MGRATHEKAKQARIEAWAWWLTLDCPRVTNRAISEFYEWRRSSALNEAAWDAVSAEARGDSRTVTVH